jgi:hypothetical protein
LGKVVWFKIKQVNTAAAALVALERRSVPVAVVILESLLELPRLLFLAAAVVFHLVQM